MAWYRRTRRRRRGWRPRRTYRRRTRHYPRYRVRRRRRGRWYRRRWRRRNRRKTHKLFQNYPRYRTSCKITLWLPISIVDHRANFVNRFTILKGGQGSWDQKPITTNWRWLPGGWSNFSISLSSLFDAWVQGFAYWSKGNTAFNLFRYFGCTITFYPDQYVDYVVSANPNLTGTDYFLWCQRCQPFMMLQDKGYKKVILSRKSAPMRRKLPHLYVPRPSNMASGWLEMQKNCKDTLLTFKCSAIGLVNTWYEKQWADRNGNITDVWFPTPDTVIGGLGNKNYVDGFPGMDYQAYMSGWLRGPAAWGGHWIQEKVKMSADSWNGSFYTLSGNRAPSNKVTSSDKNYQNQQRVINVMDGPFVCKTVPLNGCQLTARFVFHLQWGSYNSYPQISIVNDPCKPTYPVIPGANPETLQDYYTIRDSDNDSTGILTARGYRRLTRRDVRRRHRRRDHIRRRMSQEETESEFQPLTSTSEEETPISSQTESEETDTWTDPTF